MARKNSKVTTINDAVAAPEVVAQPEQEPEVTVNNEGFHHEVYEAPSVPEVQDEVEVVEKMPEQEAPKSVPPSVAAVIALQKQLNEQREAAIKQLLAQQVEIAEQLDLLGYQAEPAPFSRPAPRKAAAPRTPAAVSSGEGPYCKYCEMNGHDARAHRGQAVKRKFTAAELAALK